jgi:hypothetical protein
MKGKVPECVDLREIEDEFFNNLAAKLVRGSHKGRATLTRGECRTLLDLVRNRPAPKRERGRQVDDERAWRTMNIAIYCWWREGRGELTKNAVGETADLYGVSRATVYAARKRLLSQR